MGKAAVAGIRRQQDLALAFVVMQGVVEASDHAGGIAKAGCVVTSATARHRCRLLAVAQRFDIFRPGHRREPGEATGRLRPGFGHGVSPLVVWPTAKNLSANN